MGVKLGAGFRSPAWTKGSQVKSRATDNLDRRLRVVEKSSKANVAYGGTELMEVETVSSSRNVTMVATHSSDDAAKTWVVPLRLSDLIRVYRCSFVAKTTTSGEDCAFAVYRASPPSLSKDAPVDSTFNLTHYRTLGRVRLTSTLAQRYSITLDKELLLDPKAGYYFIGFQASGEKVKFLCPEYGFAGGTMRSAWKTTTDAGSTTGEFPSKLTTATSSTHVPYVVLRSFSGVRMLGNATEDS